MSDFVHCGLEGQLVSIAPLLLFKNRENEVLTSSRQLQLLLVRTFKNTQHQDCILLGISSKTQIFTLKTLVDHRPTYFRGSLESSRRNTVVLKRESK